MSVHGYLEEPGSQTQPPIGPGQTNSCHPLALDQQKAAIHSILLVQGRQTAVTHRPWTNRRQQNQNVGRLPSAGTLLIHDFVAYQGIGSSLPFRILWPIRHCYQKCKFFSQIQTHLLTGALNLQKFNLLFVFIFQIS